MSYPLSLDEISNKSLIEEINRRQNMLEKHKCDYCYMNYTDPPCKFPERHCGQDNIEKAIELHTSL